MTLYDRAKFKHGGILHQDAIINDVLVYTPALAETMLKETPLQYEHRFQWFWLTLYRWSKMYEAFDRKLRKRWKDFKASRRNKKVLSRVREIENSVNSTGQFPADYFE